MTSKAATFCPEWAITLVQREPVCWYSQASRKLVMKIGISTPTDIWKALKIRALIVIAPEIPYLDIRPEKK